MKKYSLLIILLFGIFSFFSCEKDETKAFLKTDIASPELSIPGNQTALVLKRTEAENKITFSTSEVDFGFQTNVIYSLEIDLSGNNFANPLTVSSNSTGTFELAVKDFNEKILSKLNEDVVNDVDVRISAFVVNKVPYVYSSVKQMQITPFGLLRLDLVGTGLTGFKLTSAAGDGIYTGYIKLDAASTFKLIDPESNKNYGVTAGALAVNGAGSIAALANGYHKIVADLNTLTYTIENYRIGIVGSATATGWDPPGVPMEYNPKEASWSATVDLKAEKIKFWKNEAWAWNMGGDVNNLTQDGSDIQIDVAGNYTVKLYINNTPFKCKITKN